MALNVFQRTLISVPFGRENETVASTRYDWDCSNRDRVPFVILQWTHSGYGAVTYQGKTTEIPSGTLFIALPPEPTRYYYPPEATQPWSFSWLNFYGDLAVTLWSAFRSQFGLVVTMPPDSEAAAHFVELVREANQRTFRDQFEASAKAYTFFAALFRLQSSPSSSHLGPVDLALQLLQTKSAARVTVKELAAVSGVSREHFSRLFQKSRGCSPAAWLRNQRLEHAASLLSSTTVPIAEVALRCGFSSGRHLRHAFRQKLGHLPNESRGTTHSPQTS